MMSTIKAVGLKQGESLESPRLGLYAKVIQATRHSLSRRVLAELGVSGDILDRGTIAKENRPYVKVGHKGKSTNVLKYPERSAHGLSAERSKTT